MIIIFSQASQICYVGLNSSRVDLQLVGLKLSQRALTLMICIYVGIFYWSKFVKSTLAFSFIGKLSVWRIHGVKYISYYKKLQGFFYDSTLINKRMWPGIKYSDFLENPGRASSIIIYTICTTKDETDGFLTKKVSQTHCFFKKFRSLGCFHCTIRWHVKQISCLLLAIRKKEGKIFSLGQWVAWNLFHVTSNGATSFKINKAWLLHWGNVVV